MDEEKRNVLIFFAISVLIMLGYPYIFNSQQQQPSAPITCAAHSAAVVSTNKHRVTNDIPVKHIKINTKNISGIISTCGAKIDNICLKQYKKDFGDDAPISVFGDKKVDYFAFSGWQSNNNDIILPNENTCWDTESTELTEKSPITLKWNNGNGLQFEKHISIDEKFLITIVDTVKNYGDYSVALSYVTKINREFKEKGSDVVSFYQGPIGYVNGKLEEVAYEDIAKKSEIKYQSKSGWFGITDKYWLVAFIPDQNTPYDISYKHNAHNDKNIYLIETRENAIPVLANQEISNKKNLFVGAKEIKTLDMYEAKLSVKHFDLALDFGCLYIMTKPLLYILAYTKDFVGNMGLGIILITLLLKLLLFPLSNKSYRSMNKMKDIQPKIQALQKKFADDKVKLGQAVSDLYKKEGVNPVGGCLPMLLQSPILFALYKVLYISIEMRHAPFIWWIHDLSMPDPMTILNLFGLIPITLPGFLQIGIWPLLMGVSMWIQQKIGPEQSDPVQANMMLIMPIMFTFMFAQLPSGLVIYWTVSNVLGIIQQYIITAADEKNRMMRKS